jgi:guanylate kinase
MISSDSTNKYRYGGETMGKCVVLAGGMGSGKTTLAKEMERRGFRRIITYTTRPPRKGEVNGVDYHFISNEEFQAKLDADFFAEATAYNAVGGRWFYGSDKKDYNAPDDTVIILNPQGVINLSVPVFLVYLDPHESVLKARALQRGDNPQEVERRLFNDRLYFEEMLWTKRPDLRITGVMPPENMADWIISLVHGDKWLRDRKKPMTGLINLT